MLARLASSSVRSGLLATPRAASTPRAFTALACAQAPTRAPALADITPDNAARFNERQRQFRESVAAAQKKREQEESQFPSVSDTSAIPPSLGRLLNSSVAEEARAREAKDGGKTKGGALSSLIYGTPEGRELDKDLERSFSQVLARGKYVHSIVFHEVYPDKVDEYTELVGKWYPKIANDPGNKVNLVGSWRTEVGDCDTFVHIWEYQRYQGYHASLNTINNHPEFPQFYKELRKLIRSKRTSLMQEFSFWPTTPPRQLGGLFELRSYTLHPGNLLEWETHWRRGLKARREVMEGVGAWFVQIGELNTVHHLWQFADLEERKVRREQSWSIEGWGETVHKTVPLIQEMKSRILIPCPWSPVA
ncbi:NIPSNAP-domain-containing protein [Westerdykella ornata]|uniref:NIPSNAP-domain-containing protein n=1 Tax=Westerdykella ornata TaxID=318751 RepID=A0A6A6JE74_WESOR|nr:NIPSNAP-domain-containing protein [Westerdykella ornata]KAF2274473.1 NIPSNAP-domain-containing protein [Westerdykella ornata]